MKSYNKFTQLFFFVLILIAFFACKPQDRQVVPYETDADEIFKSLSPNDEGSPEAMTFGAANIPGIIKDYEMTTQDSDIYIYLDNLTLLDINPDINNDIIDFIQKELAEEGFISDSFSLGDNSFKSLLAKGVAYTDAVDTIMNLDHKAFETQLTKYEYLTAFNMTFRIYPVYLDKDYITYREYCYCYTGGAHGMQYSYLKTYDLNSGKLLTLEDIVKPECIEDVREEVAAQMAYSYPIYENITTVNQYLDSLNVWLEHFDTSDSSDIITVKNFPLSNPAITEKGLAFIYQMYTLTPGSDGCPLIVVPYRDIKGCLYPQFEKIHSNH